MTVLIRDGNDSYCFSKNVLASAICSRISSGNYPGPVAPPRTDKASFDSSDSQWPMTLQLIKAGADAETRGWVTQSGVLVQVSPLELTNSWISKFGAKSNLVLLKRVFGQQAYAKLSVEGNSKHF